VSFLTISKHHATGDEPAAAASEALPDRSALASMAFDCTRMPMVVTDARQPGNPIILANRAFLEGTGFLIDEVIGHNCRFLQGPDTDPADITKIRDAVKRAEPLVIELLNYRKDRTTFWNQLYIAPVFDDAGKLTHFFASQLDISEQRRAQTQMLREIEHRTKNALALVQGIVRMSRAASVEEFSDRVQGRIDALAKAHNLLAETRWQDVSLARLIRAETDVFGIQRVNIDGPPLVVGPDQVQPLALVLHEIIANAAHHGSLSAAEGTLAIGWRSEGDATVIEVHEAGGPPPANDRAPGFGSAMMRAIMERQLRGSLDFNWHPAGLHSVLRVPNRAAP
jgi:PAS domain S-box-containing protein